MLERIVDAYPLNLILRSFEQPFSINFSIASILRTNASFPESKTAWLNSSFIKSVVDSTDDVRSSVTGVDVPQLIRKLSIMICVKFFMKLSSRSYVVND